MQYIRIHKEWVTFLKLQRCNESITQNWGFDNNSASSFTDCSSRRKDSSSPMQKASEPSSVLDMKGTSNLAYTSPGSRMNRPLSGCTDMRHTRFLATQEKPISSREQQGCCTDIFIILYHLHKIFWNCSIYCTPQHQEDAKKKCLLFQLGFCRIRCQFPPVSASILQTLFCDLRDFTCRDILTHIDFRFLWIEVRQPARTLTAMTANWNSKCFWYSLTLLIHTYSAHSKVGILLFHVLLQINTLWQ